MKEIIVNDINIKIREWNGQRIVTLADIDRVHEREEGTAKKNFQNNRKHFLDNIDYFEVTRKELREKFSPNSEPLKGNPNIKSYLFTESGYLLLVKSFTDDLAWQVQRDLINTYFKAKDIIKEYNSNSTLDIKNFNSLLEQLQKSLPTVFAQFNNIESNSEKQLEMLEKVMSNMTLTTVQQGKLHRSAKTRVNHLLNGAHSPEYKKSSKLYFINLWNGLKSKFDCGSRWQDLNPVYFDNAMEYISTWRYEDKY